MAKFAPCSQKQSDFLRSDATITVYGGSMGAAKTYGGLLRHLRWVNDPNYCGYVIRKSESVLRAGGGAFNEAVALYKAFEPKIRYTTRPMKIFFPSGATVDFKGYQSDKEREDYRGLNLSGVMVDEGTQLSEAQVDMLISRLRTSAKMDANLWITCNPDPDSYLFKWVEWYLYPKGTIIDGVLVEGRPDPAKNGKLRYFIRANGVYIFGDSEKELREKHPEAFDDEDAKCSTFRFIGATVFDNPPLLQSNPQYLTNLQSLPRVQKERDLYGSWFARAEKAGFFKREWLGEPLPTVKTADIYKRVRCWDISGSLPSETNPKPDFTVGCLMSRDRDGTNYIEDVVRGHWRFGEIQELICEVARRDTELFGNVETYVEYLDNIYGRQALKGMVSYCAQHGITLRGIKAGTKSKMTRFEPFCANAEVGNIRYVEGDWTDAYFHELEGFEINNRKQKDDQVDATSMCFSKLAQNKELPRFNLEVMVR